MNTRQAHVIVNGSHRVDMDANTECRFGREKTPSCGVGLDPSDLGISRVAGSIKSVDGIWLLTNRSSAVPLFLDFSAGQPLQRLLPGRQFVVGDQLVVIVKGLRKMHRLDIITTIGSAAAPTVGVGGDTTLGPHGVEFTEGELDALTAVFRGFLLDFPRRDCVPMSYAEAGEILGLPGSTIRKRIEKVRAKLNQADVYIDGPHAKWHLVEVILDSSIVTITDLARLQRPELPTGEVRCRR